MIINICSDPFLFRTLIEISSAFCKLTHSSSSLLHQGAIAPPAPAALHRKAMTLSFHGSWDGGQSGRSQAGEFPKVVLR